MTTLERATLHAALRRLLLHDYHRRLGIEPDPSLVAEAVSLVRVALDEPAGGDFDVVSPRRGDHAVLRVVV